MEQKIEIKQLLEKPVWQMSGEEFCQLTMYANSSCQAGGNTASKEYAYGIHELGTIIDCCDSTIYSLKKQGVLNDAIVSQIGKKIIFDVEKMTSGRTQWCSTGLGTKPLMHTERKHSVMHSRQFLNTPSTELR